MKHARALPRLFVLLPILFLASLGCGGEPAGKVSGKVTYKNQVVPGGEVIFSNENSSRIARATIQPDGTYSATRVPYGKVLVGVRPVPKGASALMPKGAKKPTLPEDAPVAGVYAQKGADFVDIPAALRDPFTSKIVVMIDSEEKTFDIDLKDVPTTKGSKGSSKGSSKP
jgi:hypothetical protein